MEKVDLEDCWSIPALVKHANQSLIRTPYWVTGQGGEETCTAYGMSHVYVPFCGRTALFLFTASSSGENKYR